LFLRQIDAAATYHLTRCRLGNEEWAVSAVFSGLANEIQLRKAGTQVRLKLTNKKKYRLA
jgi:hypothetical protein